MGQQQFLFVVLAAIIVAVALALAVAYYISYQEDANINEVVNGLQQHFVSSSRMVHETERNRRR